MTRGYEVENRKHILFFPRAVPSNDVLYILYSNCIHIQNNLNVQNALTVELHSALGDVRAGCEIDHARSERCAVGGEGVLFVVLVCRTVSVTQSNRSEKSDSTRASPSAASVNPRNRGAETPRVTRTPAIAPRMLSVYARPALGGGKTGTCPGPRP
jgi:hypothetical protein